MMIKVCDYRLGLEACVLVLASALANRVFITSLELDGRVWSLFSYLVVFIPCSNDSIQIGLISGFQLTKFTDKCW